MLPKQQAKNARYKPIGAEEPYTKKHLKVGAQNQLYRIFGFQLNGFCLLREGAWWTMRVKKQAKDDR